MAGDYTRSTFDPIKGYSGLHKQQGRVSLDAEFNEFEEILDRRGRAEMSDIVGQAVVPLATKTGFEITVSGGGQLQIGIGRTYVDGILAECFGDLSNPNATVRNDVLGGIVGSGPVPYNQQPFFYQPGYPALLGGSAINLVYLDVWQREVTVWEEDALREPALNGPDTATRVQTAWQVKVLQTAAAADSCTQPPPAWAALIAPSTARLTAQAVPSGPPQGPCVINPAGGYTGLENRLYRVEVHRGGTLAGGGGSTQATFKWSRDNASLAARVLKVVAGPVAGQSTLTVASTGRDAWMRFTPGDHLELLDDDVEFAMRERDQGGSLAVVVAVNDATGEIGLDRDLSAFVPVPARHPRIRRWDIAAPGELLERPASPSAAIALEEGISVMFGASGTDTLHAGDHWVFAARTADGSIDSVVNAPPRGILHHFARLALVTSGTPPVWLSDCRVFWPPDMGSGCCTVVVKPGEDIQAAINSLPLDFGGCVCLKAGVHPITAPIQIDRSNVHLHGECEGAEIHSPGLIETLMIVGTANARIHDVRVSSLQIVVSGGSGGVIIHSDSCDRVSVRETESRVQFSGALPPGYFGIVADASSDVVLADNVIDTAAFGIWIGNVSQRAWVDGNRITGVQYKVAALSLSMGDTGIDFDSDIAGDHRAERNVLVDFQTGIRASRGSQGAQVIGNRIFRSSGTGDGAIPLDAAALRTYLDGLAYAIDLAGGRCVADGNTIELDSPQWGGIRVSCAGAMVARNVLVADLPQDSTLLPAGIYCTLDASTGLGGGASTIRDNSLTGAQVGIVVSRVAAVSVLDNRVDGQGRGWYGLRLDAAGYTTAAGNLVAAVGFAYMLNDGNHNVVRDGRAALTFIGVIALEEIQLTVQDNEISAAFIVGMLLRVLSGDLVVARNRILNCGLLTFGGTAGLLAWSDALSEPVTDTVRIEGCEILDAGVAPDGKFATTKVIGLAVVAGNCQVMANRVVSVNPGLAALALEHRALVCVGPLLAQDSISTLTSSALVSNNVFRGPGLTHLVELPSGSLTDKTRSIFHKILFNGNFCDHLALATEAVLKNGSTVLLSGVHVAASANQVTAPAVTLGKSATINSLDCAGSARTSVVGNVTTGAIVNLGTTSPGPLPGPFNMQI